MTPRLVILDRDGTLVAGMPEGDYLIDPVDVWLVDSMAERVAFWNRLGVPVAVATNQRCVALGLATMADVSAVHARISALLADRGAHIDHWYVCPHGRDECECRKPLPGLLLQAIADAGVAPDEVLMLGDRDTDRQAANAAGVMFERVAEPHGG